MRASAYERLLMRHLLCGRERLHPGHMNDAVRRARSGRGVCVERCCANVTVNIACFEEITARTILTFL